MSDEEFVWLLQVSKALKKPWQVEVVAYIAERLCYPGKIDPPNTQFVMNLINNLLRLRRTR